MSYLEADACANSVPCVGWFIGPLVSRVGAEYRGPTEFSFRKKGRTISLSDAKTATLAQCMREARSLTATLIETEHDILKGIVAGSSLKQIALKLGLSLAQAETQKASMMRKLNAASTADLVRVGIYADL